MARSRSRTAGVTGVVTVLAMAAVLVSCPGDGRPSAGRTAPSQVSSGFSVGYVPDGYQSVTAGRGTAVQAWGSDSEGTEEPFTVLAPPGSETLSEAVIVSATGYAGYEGGLAQAGWGYWRDVVETRVDGNEAVFTAGGSQHRGQGSNWADLVVSRGDDLAVRVTSRTGPEARLATIARTIDTPTSRSTAPALAQPPAGLEAVGSANADAVLALSAYVRPDSVPGPRAAHAVGWSGPSASLAVLTLPGGSADLRALRASRVFSRFHTVEVGESAVGDQQALVLDYSDWPGSDDSRRRTVVVDTTWGDLLLVTSLGTRPVSTEDLVAVAASVQRVGPAAWADVVLEATGGPGLHPDPGRLEVGRGRSGGIEWLLQEGEALFGEPAFPDPCLKLSNRLRACASGAGSDIWSVQSSPPAGSPDLHGMAPFVVVATDASAARVRVTDGGRSAVADLVAMPRSSFRVAVVSIEASGLASCSTEQPTGLDVLRVDLLDDAGNVVGCVGLGS